MLEYNVFDVFFLELLSTFMLELKVGYASLVIVLDGEQWCSLMREKKMCLSLNLWTTYQT